MELMRRSFPEIHAGGFSRIDGTIAFYQRVNALVTPQTVMIDYGAGRGVGLLDSASDYRRGLRNFKGRTAKVVGVDVDPAIFKNPSLDDALLFGSDGRAPLPSDFADLILSDCTFEHLTNPEQSAREMDRLLKPGGWICARTPNKYGYIALANRLVPEALSHRLLKKMQPDRKEEDVFPAVYRLNTSAALAKHFPPSRFDHFVYSWDAEPAYHGNRQGLYRAFQIVQYLTPPRLKTILMVFIQKKPV
ncbi:SAM-dependent methyltransferase [Bradyrhizobium sp. LM6.11]